MSEAIELPKNVKDLVSAEEWQGWQKKKTVWLKMYRSMQKKEGY